GVSPGHVVGILCRNTRYFIDATGACSKLGAHALFLNTSFSMPQLRDVVEREGVRALVIDAEFRSLVSEDFDGPVVIAWNDDELPSGTTVELLISRHDRTAPPAPETMGRTIVLTSGTTGTPKGASRGHAGAGGAAIAMLDRIPYRTKETMVVAAPMFHSWGFGNLTIGLVIGDTHVCSRRFDPEATLATIERHRAQVLAAV